MTTKTIFSTDKYVLSQDTISKLYSVECLESSFISEPYTQEGIELLWEAINTKCFDDTESAFNEACEDYLAPDLAEMKKISEFNQELANLAKTHGRRAANYLANN